MQPYYADDYVTIYHGDCRELLPRIEADVVVTDPPYGVDLTSKTYGSGAESIAYQDDPDHIRQLIADVAPLMLRFDRAVVFSGIRMLCEYPQPAAIGGVYTPAGTGNTSWGFGSFQPILYYGKDPYLADGKGSRINGFSAARPAEPADHPCPKPVSWMRWAIERASRPGEVIVDPFAGSGSTLIAAKSLSRKAIGIELEERYCEVVAQRLSQEVLGLAF